MSELLEVRLKSKKVLERHSHCRVSTKENRVDITTVIFLMLRDKQLYFYEEISHIVFLKKDRMKTVPNRFYLRSMR